MMAGMVIFCSVPHVRAEVVGEPIRVPVFHSTKNNNEEDQRTKSMIESFFKTLSGNNANRPVSPSVNQLGSNLNRAYEPFSPYTGEMPFEQMARMCGQTKQRECSPSNFGGRTMCGLAVSEMLKCMSPVTSGGSNCNGACGNGKDFVDCANGQLGHCGYQRLSPNDPRCRMAGAVLSYQTSPTERGQMYGHVEFVCGRNEYCSVYSQPHSQPWPRYPADSCWYPMGRSS